MATLTLKGLSGASYAFEVYPTGTEFNAVGAVYAITKRTPNAAGGFDHSIIYVGQTGDLSERMSNHHNALSFVLHGATSVCVHVDGSEFSRLAKERDLINNYDPPCNG